MFGCQLFCVVSPAACELAYTQHCQVVAAILAIGVCVRQQLGE